MSINKVLISVFAASILWVGCSEDKHTNSWEDENDEANSSSSLRESFKSSSSLTTRLDITYNDTLEIGDTTIFLIENARLDTTIHKKDTTIDLVCSDDVLCLDTGATQVTLFLGEIPAGSRISLYASSREMKKDTIRIQSELGEILDTRYAVYDSSKKSETFSNFMLPGRKEMISNQFVVFKKDFYYINLSAKFTGTSHLELYVDVEESYYNYVGEESEIDMDIQDTLRGIAIIGKSPKEIKVNFGSATGYSIDLDVKGEWINKFAFYEEDKLLSEDTAGMDMILLPEDSTNWTLKLFPLNIENYLSGPFSTFEIITGSRKLAKGEYLANPDSVVKPGETLEVIRERNSQAKYYLRQEQYVWLADMKKGDSIEVKQEMKGYFGGVNNKSYTIINKKGEELASISSLNTKYKAKKDGPVYLHYLSTCPYLDNDNNDESLKFMTTVSYYGSLTSFSFFDKTEQKIIDTTYIEPGDTVYLAKFLFRTQPSSASPNMKWFTPCEDIVSHETEEGYTSVPVFNVQNISCKDNGGKELLEGEQQISSTRLIPQEKAQGGTFRLIAESVADPTKRDTLTIIVQ